MEELTEVITAAEFHPIHCNLFMYSSSKGTIKLADMRESALCDSHAKREFLFCFVPALTSRRSGQLHCRRLSLALAIRACCGRSTTGISVTAPNGRVAALALAS